MTFKQSFSMLILTVFLGLSANAVHSMDAFNYNGQIIHPAIIQDLTTSIADNGDQVISINLDDSNDSNRFYGEIKTIANGKITYCIDTEGEGRFCYSPIGQLNNSIFVLETADITGGSGIFKDILLVEFGHKMGYTLNSDTQTLTRNKSFNIINRLGSFALGDRVDPEYMRIEGNQILIGKDVGWFTQVDETNIPTDPKQAYIITVE